MGLMFLYQEMVLRSRLVHRVTTGPPLPKISAEFKYLDLLEQIGCRLVQTFLAKVQEI